MDQDLKFVLFLFSLVVVMAVAGDLALLGLPAIAWLVAAVGTLAINTVAIGWVVFFQSKKRWPHKNFINRIFQLMTQPRI